MNFEEIYVWLSSIDEMNCFTYMNLLKYFNDVENIYLCSSKKELSLILKNQVLINKLLDNRYKEKAKVTYQQMKNDNIHVITYDSSKYIESLKNVYMPPFVYYIKGKYIEENLDKILVTGTKKETSYGKNVVKAFVSKLVSRNFEIVTSLEKGIDNLVINEVIENKGKVIAVSFKGFDNIVQKEEKDRLNKVIDSGGYIISEIPYNKKVQRNKYYLTNRILSGILDKVLLVEAEKNSKCNILIEMALDQGKEIYIVPGSIFSNKSYSCNMYIKEGANLVINTNDIP